MKRLKEFLFIKICNMEFSEFNKKNNSEYVNKYVNELPNVENRYFGTLSLLMGFSITTLFVVIALFRLNWKLALITIFLLTMPLYVPKAFEKSLKRKMSHAVEENSLFISKIKNIFEGFEIIKNFSIERAIKDKFDLSNRSNMLADLHNKDMQVSVRAISMFMSYFSHFAIVIFSAYLVVKGDFSIGKFFISIGLVDQLSYPIIATAGCIQNLISIKRINTDLVEFIGDSSQIHEHKHSYKFNEKIKFNKVSYSYDQKELIKDITLTFEKNKKYLLKGDSGTGKTTLVNLLLNYYKDYEGIISIDNKDIKSFKNIFDDITVVRQENFLFEDTLRNNISLYKNISDEDIISTLKKVDLGKYATKESLAINVKNNGSNLSGGERKRISIARALLCKKNIIIFDEPLANLDKTTMSTIEREILSIKDSTIIIISHIISKESEGKFDFIYSG